MVKCYIVSIALMFMTGCVGTTIESARMTNDKLNRDKHMDAARAGDAEAQYQVGLSYCCAPRSEMDAFYSNRKATEFLCQAARQNHAGAAYQLGNFHSGDRIDGVRWIRRAATLVRGDDLENLPVSYYWYNQAWLNGNMAAVEQMKALGEQDVSGFTDPVSTPCTVDEVYGLSNSTINQ